MDSRLNVLGFSVLGILGTVLGTCSWSSRPDSHLSSTPSIGVGGFSFHRLETDSTSALSSEATEVDMDLESIISKPEYDTDGMIAYHHQRIEFDVLLLGSKLPILSVLHVWL